MPTNTVLDNAVCSSAYLRIFQHLKTAETIWLCTTVCEYIQIPIFLCTQKSKKGERYCFGNISVYPTVRIRQTTLHGAAVPKPHKLNTSGVVLKADKECTAYIIGLAKIQSEWLCMSILSPSTGASDDWVDFSSLRDAYSVIMGNQSFLESPQFCTTVISHCYNIDFHSSPVCRVVSNRSARYIFHSIDSDGSHLQRPLTINIIRNVS